MDGGREELLGLQLQELSWATDSESKVAKLKRCGRARARPCRRGGAYNNSIVWPPHAAMLAARQRGRNMCEIISHLRFGDGQLWGARDYVPSKDRDGTRGGAAEPMPPCAANRGEYCNHTEEYRYPVLRL